MKMEFGIAFKKNISKHEIYIYGVLWKVILLSTIAK